MVQKILVYSPKTNDENRSHNIEIQESSETLQRSPEISCSSSDTHPRNKDAKRFKSDKTSTSYSYEVGSEKESSHLLKGKLFKINQKEEYSCIKAVEQCNQFLEGTQLPYSSLLGRLLYLQLLGSVHEIQAAMLYKELQKRGLDETSLQELLTNYEFIEPIEEQKEKNVDTLAEPKQDPNVIIQGYIKDIDTPTICQLLQECLISMSAKDASLMILIEGPVERHVFLFISTSVIS